jgi:hypothetical protein
MGFHKANHSGEAFSPSLLPALYQISRHLPDAGAQRVG